MKVTHVLTCALVACSMAASAASVEETLNVNVVGWYQGVPTFSTNHAGQITEHDHIQLVRFTSTSLVNALAIDLGRSDLFNGQLIYKEALDGSITNVVIRQPRTTNEVDVTTNFTFVTGPFVVDQIVNTNAPFTNNYTETGLRSVSFFSSSLSFTNNGGFSTGSLKRSRKVFGAGTNGYGNLLSYSGGGGTFELNTNTFYVSNFTFAASNTVTGPAQINFATFTPVISPNDPFPPTPPN